MIKDNSGDVLQLSNVQSVSDDQVELRNNLRYGAINANCYRDGKLLASKKGLAPGQKVVFKFKPNLYIEVISQVEEGDVMNSAIISQINSQISLLGIMSADIVMTGGGPDANSTPFNFTLENINN